MQTQSTATASSRYEARGVSSSKEEVHAAIANLDQGLFPGAFCKILPDVLSEVPDPNIVNIQHADGAGTKVALAYLFWKLTKEMWVWPSIAQCSMVMNIDDVFCAGGTGPFLATQIINRNKALVPGEVVAAIIDGCQKFCDLLCANDVPCRYAGGETADVGDLVRTLTVDNVVSTRFSVDKVIDASNIAPGNVLVGFSSTGKASWESEANSSMGCNGLTNARHETLCSEYRIHTETYAPETRPSLIYCGDYHLGDTLPGDETFSIATALLSSTRTYAPLMAYLLKKIDHKYITGFIHNSGGGQTKIGYFGRPGNIYFKDNLFPTPPLFKMLHEVRKLPMREMYSSYNMGHRLEVAVADVYVAQACIEMARAFNIEARVIGNVGDNSEQKNVRQVRITTPDGEVLEPFILKV